MPPRDGLGEKRCRRSGLPWDNAAERRQRRRGDVFADAESIRIGTTTVRREDVGGDGEESMGLRGKEGWNSAPDCDPRVTKTAVLCFD